MSATVPKRQLGMRLRQLREQLGLEREDAAKALDCSPSKIGRIETGDVGVKSAELRVLLDLYHVDDDEERDDLARLAGQSRGRRKRTDYAKAIPDWFRKYINLEEGATQVKHYQTELVPGALQTEAYARAITQANPLHDPHDVERLVQARLARQKFIFDERIELSVVMNEGVLHRQVGGPEVMRKQLDHLVEMGRRDHVTIQVMPFERGAHAATGFAFSLLRLPNDDGLDVVYLEDMTSARYVDNDPEEQQRYGIIWNHLVRGAMTPKATTNFLTTLLRKP